MTNNQPSLHELDIDGVLCISLEHRSDRRERLIQEFRDSGLEIEFYIINAASIAGATELQAHQACAALALKRGYRRVILLEDSASFEGATSRQVRQINDFMDSDYPELFYLGANLGELWLTWHACIARCVGKSSHAYILNRAGCRKLVRLEFSGMDLHRLFAQQFKAYSVFPMISQQHATDPVSIDHKLDDQRLPKRKHQYIQARRNILKTLMCRDL